MVRKEVKNFIEGVLDNLPEDWVRLTTHRLDIYNEELAKTEFLEQFDSLFKTSKVSQELLSKLPTAFDYIRLGHPLSCVLEWAIAKSNNLPSDNVISFSSSTVPILAILRKNQFEKKRTKVFHSNALPKHFDLEVVKRVYEYDLEVEHVQNISDVTSFDGSSIYLSDSSDATNLTLDSSIDFHISIHNQAGSVIIVNRENTDYISEIQHVRRRETIAMTPANCLNVLETFAGKDIISSTSNKDQKVSVLETIKSITGTNTNGLVASSGLSIQYAILMGLVHDARVNHPDKEIRIIVPPNCYGGTNDQARRVAACLSEVEIVDFPVDAGNDMVQSIDMILNDMAQEDAVPLIIAEIPTNPRVEVPDLEKLREALSKSRSTPNGSTAIDPVFILDQTFCPNVHFLGANDILASVRTISFASGSKFPSGGLCTAGYCVANERAENLINRIEQHLLLCDNEATDFQYDILARQMPSMIQRIAGAYQNTRSFVKFIEEYLPDAKINFVSEELADQGFTPSVFSLDLPTKGNSPDEREAYKRELNLKLINLMISEIPEESKYCVSYGQLKGCYWTVPATSTQGTTKEGDKDYIARVALSANMDLEKHKNVFTQFVESL
ncbi:PLP-dependent aminotransferase family protein [Ekhidna sp.]